MPQSFTPSARTAPTIVSGFRDTSLGSPTQRPKPDISDEMVFWEPEATPAIALSKAIRKKKVTGQREFGWFEQEPLPREMRVAADALAGATAIVVDAGQAARVSASCVVRCRETREIMLVTATDSPADNDLTVVRAIGADAGVALTAGMTLEWIGTAFEDASGAPTSRTVKPSYEKNYTQIFKHSFSLSGRDVATVMFAGPDKVTTARGAAIEHKKSIEKTLFFGRRHMRNPTLEQSFSGGLDYFIQSNVWNLNGYEPTWAAFVEFLEYAMIWGRGGTDHGNGKKFLFGSPRWMSLFSKWAYDKIRIVDSPDVKRLGVKIMELETPHGVIMLVRQPLFIGADAGLAYLVDLNEITYRYMMGRDSQLQENLESNDVDGETHQWFADCGWEISCEAAHARLEGLPPVGSNA